MKQSKYRKGQVEQHRVLVGLWGKYALNKSYFGLTPDVVEEKVGELGSLVGDMADGKRKYRSDMVRRNDMASLLLDWRFGVISAMKGDPDLGPVHPFLAELDMVPRKNCTGCHGGDGE
ncbi:MAG: hypothetical protein CMO74_03725 [Verrucomicrobiales bacterium]|nr:hypothetical protein [Verrucomicrobiales bacterium]|tara:strand:+ start:1363 stop:1716 length:354 start_codon:yes stop_codon:yes gene_type:complete